MLVALLIPCIASAAPFFERLQTELREDPRATSASLRRPDGPLATAWPETRGDLEGAPVYVVDVDVQSTFLRFDLVASWTNPSAEPVGSLQLRWPAEALGAYAPLYSVEGGTARVDKDLLWLDLDAPLAPGDTAVVRLRGAVHPGSFTERQWRLGQVADGYIAAAWLPHFAHHDGKRWDPVPMAPVGDPTAPIAGVFLARLIPSDERPLQLVHPGVRLVDDGEQVVLAAVGARELSLGVLGASWQAVSSSFNDEANTQAIGGYTLFGLRSSWKASDEVKLEFKLDNAFDKRYSRTLYSFDGGNYGYREEGRTWMFGVTWTPEL